MLLPVLQFSVTEEWPFHFKSRMPATREFFFATWDSIYRLFASRPASQQQSFQRLNQAHPNLNSGPILGWRLDSGGKEVR
jgi:hypothetical protein